VPSFPPPYLRRAASAMGVPGFGGPAVQYLAVSPSLVPVSNDPPGADSFSGGAVPLFASDVLLRFASYLLLTVDHGRFSYRQDPCTPGGVFVLPQHVSDPVATLKGGTALSYCTIFCGTQGSVRGKCDGGTIDRSTGSARRGQ
jgi:hypothetical protein